MDSITLGRAIQSLCRIENAGLLEEFRLDVAAATRGPVSDLDRHPEWKYTVAKISRVACQMLGVPAHQATTAAIQALLPSTRESITLSMLDQYDQRLDAEQMKAAAQRSTRAFNRRRVGA